jgi:hypothetical protein
VDNQRTLDNPEKKVEAGAGIVDTQWDTVDPYSIEVLTVQVPY